MANPVCHCEESADDEAIHRKFFSVINATGLLRRPTNIGLLAMTESRHFERLGC